MENAELVPQQGPPAGTTSREIQDKIKRVSGGNFQIRFFEPGALIPPAECFDAVRSGSVDACWSTPAYWYGRDPAFALFSAAPFGPDWPGLLAWFHYKGGKEIFEELYHKHGMHTIHIDATEFAAPSVDWNLGFYQILDNYYFPGWHQPATIYDIMIDKKKWDGLSETQQAQLEMVCGDNVRQAIADSESQQPAALARHKAEGVNVREWSPEILDTLEQSGARWRRSFRRRTRPSSGPTAR